MVQLVGKTPMLKDLVLRMETQLLNQLTTPFTLLITKATLARTVEAQLMLKLLAQKENLLMLMLLTTMMVLTLSSIIQQNLESTLLKTF